MGKSPAVCLPQRGPCGIRADGERAGVGLAGSDSPYTWTGKTGPAAAGVNSAVVVDSKWHHFCLTYADGTLSIYLDGVLRQTAAVALNTELKRADDGRRRGGFHVFSRES